MELHLEFQADIILNDVRVSRVFMSKPEILSVKVVFSMWVGNFLGRLLL